MNEDENQGRADRARELNDRQRMADLAHHNARVAWLTSDRPCFACGTPLAGHVVQEMLRESREALRSILDHGMSCNHAAIE